MDTGLTAEAYDGLGMVLGYGVEGFVVVMPGMSPYLSVILFNAVLLMLSCSEKNKKERKKDNYLPQFVICV